MGGFAPQASPEPPQIRVVHTCRLILLYAMRDIGSGTTQYFLVVMGVPVIRKLKRYMDPRTLLYKVLGSSSSFGSYATSLPALGGTSLAILQRRMCLQTRPDTICPGSRLTRQSSRSGHWLRHPAQVLKLSHGPEFPLAAVVETPTSQAVAGMSEAGRSQ